jgi:TM2 domain-containing membrane protein YozV
MLLVCVYFGVFGAHRFVMGRPLGLVMLLTFVISVPLCFVLVGFLGVFSVYVWVIVDLLSIPRWVREHNAALLVRMRTESRIAAAR